VVIEVPFELPRALAISVTFRTMAALEGTKGAHMSINPYLTFDGRCAEAFAHYATLLGGKVTFKMTYGESPMGEMTPPDWKEKIMHSTLEFPDRLLQGADAPPDRYEAPKGISIAIALSDVAEAERIFAGLSDGGTTVMPLQETFWAARFGMVVDRYGIPWMVNCEAPRPA
jgi:PhnB protein